MSLYISTGSGKGIHYGIQPPSKTDILWFDQNDNKLKMYDTLLGAWTAIGSGGDGDTDLSNYYTKDEIKLLLDQNNKNIIFEEII